jgi:2-polyprenyl-3-methyl-5-hydroxy-6-metoxy-1,4-benzoquinol methylase
VDHTDLHIQDGELACERCHQFFVEQGIPVLTDQVRREAIPGNMEPCRSLDQGDSIDPFVSDWLVNTNGNLYWRARGNLRRYPIPHWPFAGRNGQVLVDVGCSWGRWSIAAARAGYSAIGLDVHIDALAAAGRVSRQLGVQADYVCGDVEHLPFQARSIDILFSYSVLQHVDRAKVLQFFQEASRVLKPQGLCIVQLPNVFGLYNILLEAKRGFRDAKPGTFEMRYWSKTGIRDAVEGAGLRDLEIRADGFFTQNPQFSDLDLLSPAGRIVVLASHAGRKAASVLPVLTRLADSLWVKVQAPSDAPKTAQASPL